MHPLQGCGRDRRLQGTPAGAVHPHLGGIRRHARGVGESHKGAALLHGRPPTGLVPGGKIQGCNWPERHGIPGPQLRAAFQRASLPEPLRLPVHYPDYPRKKPAAEQLLHPLPGGHHSPGGQGQGGGGPVHGERGPVRTHHGRFRAGGA